MQAHRAAQGLVTRATNTPLRTTSPLRMAQPITPEQPLVRPMPHSNTEHVEHNTLSIQTATPLAQEGITKSENVTVIPEVEWKAHTRVLPDLKFILPHCPDFSRLLTIQTWQQTQHSMASWKRTVEEERDEKTAKVRKRSRQFANPKVCWLGCTFVLCS
jgi:hypothetical protein